MNNDYAVAPTSNFPKNGLWNAVENISTDLRIGTSVPYGLYRAYSAALFNSISSATLVYMTDARKLLNNVKSRMMSDFKQLVSEYEHGVKAAKAKFEAINLLSNDFHLDICVHYHNDLEVHQPIFRLFRPSFTETDIVGELTLHVNEETVELPYEFIEVMVKSLMQAVVRINNSNGNLVTDPNSQKILNRQGEMMGRRILRASSLFRNELVRTELVYQLGEAIKQVDFKELASVVNATTEDMSVIKKLIETPTVDFELNCVIVPFDLSDSASAEVSNDNWTCKSKLKIRKGEKPLMRCLLTIPNGHNPNLFFSAPYTGLRNMVSNLAKRANPNFGVAEFEEYVDNIVTGIVAKQKNPERTVNPTRTRVIVSDEKQVATNRQRIIRVSL